MLKGYKNLMRFVILGEFDQKNIKLVFRLHEVMFCIFVVFFFVYFKKVSFEL